MPNPNHANTPGICPTNDCTIVCFDDGGQFTLKCRNCGGAWVPKSYEPIEDAPVELDADRDTDESPNYEDTENSYNDNEELECSAWQDDSEP